MKNGRVVMFIGVVSFTALFLMGIAHVFHIRLSAGDIYPAYSTLRADPLGARAFYESLERLGDPPVRRSFEPLDRVESGPFDALILAGWDPYAAFRWHTNMPPRLLELAEHGTRVVLAFQAYAPRARAIEGERKQREPEDNETNEREVRDNDEEREGIIVWRKWKDEVEIEWHEFETVRDPVAERTVAAPRPLPKEVAWRGAWGFRPLNDAWTVIYEREGVPVVIERDYGMGGIVLVGDAYLLSNEGVWRHRETSLLWWLIGDVDRVVFLESHHGLTARIGIMTLIRQFRLHGVIVGLIFLTLLFVWQQYAPLIPPEKGRNENRLEEEIGVTGRDVHSGMVSLLKRAVPPRRLPVVCVDEWAADQRVRDRRNAEVLKKLRTHLERTESTGDDDPVRVYRDLCHLVKERK